RARTCGLLSAPAVAGQAPAAPAARAGGRARLAGTREDLDEPGVDGDPFSCGRGLEPRLEALGQAEGDPGRERLVDGLDGGGFLVADEHELRIAAGEPDLDAPVVELARELERRLAERLEEAPAECGLECDREELGRAGGRLVADRRDPGEVLSERLDGAVDLHDGSMTSE